MQVFNIDLKNEYPFLNKDGANPTVTAYIQAEDIKRECGWKEFTRPAMVVCPGGAYAFCSTRESEPIALNFLNMGFNVFVLNYSVKPYKFPQAIREVACTFDLINKNCEKWNIDTSRTAICGFSAGGHLAASYCTLADCDEVTSVIKAPKISAAVLCYPVISGDPDFTHIDSIKNISGSETITEEVKQKFSLEKHVSKGITPQTFIWHTAADESVPVRNSTEYANALAKEGISFEMHILPFGGHGLSTCDKQTCTGYKDETLLYDGVWLDLVKRWFKKVFDL